jgi:hypothetical protein
MRPERERVCVCCVSLSLAFEGAHQFETSLKKMASFHWVAALPLHPRCTNSLQGCPNHPKTKAVCQLAFHGNCLIEGRRTIKPYEARGHQTWLCSKCNAGAPGFRPRIQGLWRTSSKCRCVRWVTAPLPQCSETNRSMRR